MFGGQKSIVAIIAPSVLMVVSRMIVPGLTHSGGIGAIPARRIQILNYIVMFQQLSRRSAVIITFHGVA
ncbi:MAG: hypothetical protein ACLUHA_14925 [Bacteroides stercoris]